MNKEGPYVKNYLLICKFIFMSIGQWPYQRGIVKLIIKIAFFMILFTIWIAQVNII